MCLLCRLPVVAKNSQVWAIFDIPGTPVPILSPTRAIFGVLEHIQGLHLRAKFHVNVLRLPVGKNHNFGQTLIFGDSCTDPLLLMRTKFGVLKQTQGLHLYTPNSSECIYCVGFRWPKAIIFSANFDIKFGAPVPTYFYR